MKNTTNLPTRPTSLGLVLILAATVLSSYVARAVPYASCITNNGTTVTFYLNEAADGVKVIYDGGGVGKTNNLGALGKGLQSFSYTGHTSYNIEVTKNAAVGWTLISDDTNPYCEYASPRGVAVSQVASNLSTFGRIYVSDSLSGGRVSNIVTHLARTNAGKGVFILNADQSDALGQTVFSDSAGIRVQALSNGVTWGTPLTQSSPFHISFGPDNKLYMNSFGTVDATTWRSTTPDCSSFELVLSGIGENANPTVHTDSSTKIIVKGSTQDGTMQMWMLDGAYAGHENGIAQWDILGGPLPWNTAPTFVGVATAYQSVPDVTCDLDVGHDGKWFIMVNRADGTDRASIQEYDTDGTTLLFDSLSYFGSPDPLRTARACALSPDGKSFAFVRDDNTLKILGLNANGVIDPNTLQTFVQPASTSVTAPATGFGRAMCYDAAGNIYTVGSGQARLRVFAPGGFTTASTKSDGTFVLTTPANNVSVAATTPVTTMDTTQPPGVFTLTRTGNTASPVTVGYTLTGTATNNIHYNLLSGTVTFLGGETSTNVFVVAKPITPAGPTRSVVMTLNSGSNTYTPVTPLSATVFISDTNTPALSVVMKDSQFYERTNDYARFTITRFGNTNVGVGIINVTYGGTAVAGTHYYADAAVSMNAGDVTKDYLINPIHDGVVTGPKTVIVTVAASGDGSYTVGTPAISGATTRVDSDDPPETVLWSDNLQTDTSANWTYRFATTNGAPDDFCVNTEPTGSAGGIFGTWPMDYSGLTASTPAPHSGSDTHGLYMTVNKNDGQLAAAALNFYPNGQNFSGNYAFRFDMFLIMNSTSGQTEYALFGINHSGSKTNWFRNSAAGFTGVDPVGWNFDGVFYAVEADGAHLGDYVGYSSPTTAGRNPTPITPGVGAATLQTVFKDPPWTPGGDNGGAAANKYGTSTPIWADVELAQINNVIYWSINHTLIFAYTNTTGYTSGNVMLGYTDAYDSIGASGGSVTYANPRVISLAGPVITQIVPSGGNWQITFTANAGDVPAQFVLQQSSPLVTGAYADTTSTISSLGGGVFRAVKPIGAAPNYFRIRRLY